MTFQESETLELKEIVVEDIKKEIIAFANSAGGTLYVGVADDGGIVGVENPDMVIQQISNMVRDSIKPDITMFIRYTAKNVERKQIVAVEIQRGTERPYYLAKKGLRPEGVYVRQGTSSVPATSTAIRRMIKDTDGDSFEAMRSLEQNLTFQAAEKEFVLRDLAFGVSQMKTLKVVTVFNAVFLIVLLAVCGLLQAQVISLTGQQEQWLLMAVFSCLFLFFGALSPRLPYQRHTGLRLPWTVQDEDTWNLAHRIIGVISLPMTLLYLAAACSVSDFEHIGTISVIALMLYIGIPGVISLVFFWRKYH